jgi:hypothetical protein
VYGFAREKAATPPQISLAWMLHKKPFIVPIPGSRKLERIEENLGTADIHLTNEEFARIEAELAKIDIHGNRTDEDIAKLRYLDCPRPARPETAQPKQNRAQQPARVCGRCLVQTGRGPGAD